MGLDIEKTQEELNKKLIQTVDNTPLEEPISSEGGLNAVESQNLKTELSGEVITPGFTDQEAEELTNKLSGGNLSPEDSIVLSKPAIDDTTTDIIQANNTLPETEQNSTETNNINTPNIESLSKTKESPQNTIQKPVGKQETADITTIINNSNIKDYFSKLNLNDFRIGISSLQTIAQLNIIRLLINEMPYSKAEKLMLFNECTKQQGILQSMKNEYDIENGNKPSNMVSQKHASRFENNDESVGSKIAYELYTLCKTPVQRDLAKYIINLSEGK